MLTHAIPIESQFKALLPDNLNAEIVLGSVSNVKEAVNWLTYTYLAVRMRQNPLVYGISFEQLAVRHDGSNWVIRGALMGTGWPSAGVGVLGVQASKCLGPKGRTTSAIACSIHLLRTLCCLRSAAAAAAVAAAAG
jgi:hypothetical protein